MIKALYYKEWLKIRWAFFSITGVFILDLIKIALNISYNIRFMEANNYWYQITILGSLFYLDLNYLPIAAGIVLAAFQFAPEISADRLKLTLHLPLHENTILLSMISAGLLALSLIFITTYILFILIMLNFFPAQIIYSALLTSLPWFLAGFTGYMAASMIFLEPIWLKRAILILLSASYVDLLLYKSVYNQYEPSILIFALITLFFITAIFYPALRFRKGVRK